MIALSYAWSPSIRSSASPEPESNVRQSFLGSTQLPVAPKGRIGAILSSSLGGLLMGAFPGQSAIFFILALPALLAAISIVTHRNVQLTMKIKGAGLGEIPALSETLNNR